MMQYLQMAAFKWVSGVGLALLANLGHADFNNSFKYTNQDWYNSVAISDLEIVAKKFEDKCLRDDNTSVCRAYQSQIFNLFKGDLLNENAVPYVISRLHPNPFDGTAVDVSKVYQLEVDLFITAVQGKEAHLQSIMDSANYAKLENDSLYSGALKKLRLDSNNLNTNKERYIDAFCNVDASSMMGGSGEGLAYVRCVSGRLSDHLGVLDHISSNMASLTSE